jgi:voltage-gated sodium channel
VNSDRAHGVSRFEAVVPAAILANSVVLGWGWIDHAHDVAAERIDTCFLVFFLVELFARLRHGGWRWLKQPWNFVDAGIIVLALLPVVGDSITVLRAARIAKLVHLGRHISHLRIAAWLGRWINVTRGAVAL